MTKDQLNEILELNSKVNDTYHKLNPHGLIGVHGYEVQFRAYALAKIIKDFNLSYTTEDGGEQHPNTLFISTEYNGVEFVAVSKEVEWEVLMK